MKRQKFGTADVNLNWFLETDDYTKRHNRVTLDTEKGKDQLVNMILMLLEQGKEIRIGTDGICLVLEANDGADEFTDASYQYVDDDCEVMLRKEMPDGTYQYFLDEDEYQATLKAFLEDNPDYCQNEYGRWYKPMTWDDFKDADDLD